MRWILRLTIILVITSFGKSSVYGFSWETVLHQSAGQTVYFHAWGGSPKINAYIEKWSEIIKEKFDVNVKHVKVEDISISIKSIQTAKRIGEHEYGSVDLVWINGENFARMKREGLLGQPFAQLIPAAQNIDWTDPSIMMDFSVPTQGLEAPWGRAQLVFIHDSETVPSPPKSMSELLEWVQNNPGKFTYPEPPNFHGTTFLKQIMLELSPSRKWLLEPFQQSRFEIVTSSTWDYLDAIHPFLWRAGREFPDSAEVIMDMFANGGLNLAMSFNPNDASQRIIDGRFPKSARTHIHRTGTIGNTHFLAIPTNARSREGALITVNTLLSAKAQADKADPKVWGDPTVLSMALLNMEEKAYFQAIPKAPATLSPDELGTPLPEPHASWVEPIEMAWKQRYLSGRK